MASYELLAAFLVTTALFANVPGPAMLYTIAQTMARGRAAGLMAVLGIHLGCYIHIVAAVAGLSMLFQAVPWLYIAFKFGGACYLIWLGFSMLRARLSDNTTGSFTIGQKSSKRAFIDSVVVEMLNPKTALFFLAFLPQFVDPAAAFPVWLQFLVLGVAVNITFTSADFVVVMVAGLAAGRLKRSAFAQGIARRAAGAILMGLGLRLAWQRS